MRIERIPRTFYDDHTERGLPAPPVVRETKRHYWIDVEHEDCAELHNDAAFYADPWGPDAGPPGLKAAARGLLQALPPFAKCSRCREYRIAHVDESGAPTCAPCLDFGVEGR